MSRQIPKLHAARKRLVSPTDEHDVVQSPAQRSVEVPIASQTVPQLELTTDLLPVLFGLTQDFLDHHELATVVLEVERIWSQSFPGHTTPPTDAICAASSSTSPIAPAIKSAPSSEACPTCVESGIGMTGGAFGKSSRHRS